MVFILWLVAVRVDGCRPETNQESSLPVSDLDDKDLSNMIQPVEGDQKGRKALQNSTKAYPSRRRTSTICRWPVRKAHRVPLLRIYSKRQLFMSSKRIIKSICPKVYRFSASLGHSRHYSLHRSLVGIAKVLRVILVAARQCEELVTIDDSSLQLRDIGSLTKGVLTNLGVELNCEGWERVASIAPKLESRAVVNEWHDLD